MHPYKLDCIKPTRLWHLTGKKHFWGILKDRYSAVKHTHEPLIKRDVRTLLGLSLAAVSAILYSYGRFSPKAKPPEKECRPEKRPTIPCPRKSPCHD